MIDDFKCRSCGEVSEILYRRDYVVYCPVCGSKELTKIINAPHVKFVGAGWETNDKLDFWADTDEKRRELAPDAHSHKDSKEE